MLSKKLFCLVVFFTFCGVTALKSQSSLLEEYVEEGLSNNLVLRQRHVSLEKALLGLQTAKSMYQPSINLQANYTSATGGRAIFLPLGQLLNPVYNTLNQLTGTGAFPTLQDESINFLPRNYYDARVRTTVPIVNTDIAYNKRINEEQVTLQAYEVDTYQRELVKNIKEAYFQFLSAGKAIEVHQSALNAALESKRVNERLYENGKGLPAYILRSESEVEQLQAELLQARQNLENTRLYFNALLNRSANERIETDFDMESALLSASSMAGNHNDVERREELKSLEQVVKISETALKMNRKFRIPQLSGFVDLGSQAEQMRFDSQSRYVMFGLQFDLPIYNGNRNHFKIRQSELDLLDARLNRQEAVKQLSMSAEVARNQLITALGSYKASLKQLKAAESYQRLIERGFAAGTNTFLESIDARGQLHAAQLSVSIQEYQVLSAAAGLEREVASYAFSDRFKDHHQIH